MLAKITSDSHIPANDPAINSTFLAFIYLSVQEPTKNDAIIEGTVNKITEYNDIVVTLASIKFFSPR